MNAPYTVVGKPGKSKDIVYTISSHGRWMPVWDVWESDTQAGTCYNTAIAPTREGAEQFIRDQGGTPPPR